MAEPPVTRPLVVDVLPWAVLVLLIAVDTVSPSINISGAYPIAAVVASTITAVRPTSCVAVASVALAGLSFTWNDSLGLVDFWLRLVLSSALGAVAVVSALIRVRRERALATMTVIAETVQRAVLRPIPSQLGTVGFASQYRSASRAALVGGDLFEVADTVHGVRVVVGDVRGKGLDAVALAATVLGAFRQAALSQDELSSVASEIDKVVTAVAGEEDFVTAIFCQFAPGGRVTLVNRGHPVPLLVPPGPARPRYLDTGEPQPPLGLEGLNHSVETTWARGARLLLYTDGLVEARDVTGTFFPLDTWAPALVTGDPEAALERLVAGVQEFSGNEATDDMAVMLCENGDGAPPADPAHRGTFSANEDVPLTSAPGRGDGPRTVQVSPGRVWASRWYTSGMPSSSSSRSSAAAICS